MSDDKKKKIQQLAQKVNSLETLNDVARETKKVAKKTKDQAKKEVTREIPQAALEQLVGKKKQASGVLREGQSINIAAEISNSSKKEEVVQKNKKKEVLRSQYHERVVRESKKETQQKIDELRMQLKAIMDEVVVLAKDTGEIGEELQIAAMQAPVEPGEYHINFFQELLSFIKSFRKKIKDASHWLNASNKRAQKKNYWAKYKKHGAKFLLSSESYSSRSAG